jgi:hypothetical protein
MACACGKNKSLKFVVTFSDGSKKEYSTEIEAAAAVARRGGSFTPKAK